MFGAGCGSSPGKRKVPMNTGGEAGEAGSSSDGGASGGSTHGTSQGGEGGTPLLPSGLSVPASLRFDIPCGSSTAQGTMSLTNWSESEVEITAYQIEGAFKLETPVPLSLAPGASVALVVSTDPGVVGTDAPGDQRQGALTLTSTWGAAVVELEASVVGTSLQVGRVPGALLAAPLSFSCSSAAEL